MRVILQRVKQAKVIVADNLVGEIGAGWLIFLGVGTTDTIKDVEVMVQKVINLRLFSDDAGKFNLSVLDVKGEILVVSQFTLYADCRKGRRPSFTDSAPPSLANELYEKFIFKIKETGLKVASGKFGADMLVQLTNDGPVTISLDTKDF